MTSSATLTDEDRRTRRSSGTPSPAARPAPPPTSGPRVGLEAWHFFLLSTAALTVVSVVVLRHLAPAALAMVALTVASAGYAAFMVFRTLHPLVGHDDAEPTVMLAGRTRGALERDKALTLRTIKELEFDYAMGKVADGDFAEMRDRLRARAVRLMRQLEGATAYRMQIERDLEARLGPTTADSPDAAPVVSPSCAACGADNEGDARFCKMCGQALARRG
jgi:hypothetical protein